MLTRATRAATRTSGVLLPVEIWTIILDLTIHVPRLFDTDWTNLSFAQYKCMENSLYNDEEAYHASERQRLILRAVCSAWCAWADARKSRYIANMGTRTPFEDVQNAVRVPLLARSPKSSEIRHDKPSRWRIIDARIHSHFHATCFKHLSLHANKHPLLRRMNISLLQDLCEVIRYLPAFKHITYLSLDFRSVTTSFIRWFPVPPPRDTTTAVCPITLPNVQVLEFFPDNRIPNHYTVPPSNDLTPLAFILNLPQLAHFYFYGGLRGGRLEFDWLSPFTLRGLKSLMVGVGGSLEIEWSELPNLEELACMNFEPKLLEPIPKIHPLQRVYLFGPWSIETFDALTAGLEAGSGTNLREVHLRTMRWDQEGQPVPTPREQRQGSAADDKLKDEFCDKVRRFEELYGLKTLDYYQCTRDNPYKLEVPGDEDSRESS